MSIRSYISEWNIPMRRTQEPGFRKQLSPDPTIHDSPNILSLFQQISTFKTAEHDEIKKCVVLFEYLSTTDDLTKTVIRALHTQLLIDDGSTSWVCRNMAVFIAELVKVLNLKDEKKAFFVRAQWLSLLQEDFDKRDELCIRTNVFLNAVQFHGEIYKNLLIANAKLKCLAVPLLQYLTMLLKSPTEPKLRVLLLQLAANSADLKINCGVVYESFLVDLRKALLRDRADELLLAIDITSGQFPARGGPLHSYYQDTLKELFEEVECMHLGVEFVRSEPPPTAIPRPVQTSTPLEDVSVATFPQLEESEAEKMKQSVGILTNAEAVRERMRSKGILPGRPLPNPANKGVS